MGLRPHEFNWVQILSKLWTYSDDDVGVEDCIIKQKRCVSGRASTHNRIKTWFISLRDKRFGVGAERGATIALVGVILTAIFIAGALAVDLSAAERRAQQLQDAADASSMAAAKVWAETSQTDKARARAIEVIKLNNVPDSVKNNLAAKVHISFPDGNSVRVRIADDTSGVVFGGAVGYDPGVTRVSTSRWSTCSGDSCNAGLLRPLEAQNLFPTLEYGSGVSDFTHADPSTDLFNVDVFDIHSINLDNEPNRSLVAQYGDNLYFLQHHRRGTVYCFNTVRQGPCWEKKSTYVHGGQPLGDRSDARTQFASKMERIPGTTRFYFLTQAGARRGADPSSAEQTYLRCFDVATATDWISQEKRKTALLEGVITFEPETVAKNRPAGDCGKKVIETDGFYVDYRRKQERSHAGVDVGSPPQRLQGSRDLRAYGFTERAGGLFSHNGNIYVFVTQKRDGNCGNMLRVGYWPPYTYTLVDCDASYYQKLLCFNSTLGSCGAWDVGTGVPINGLLDNKPRIDTSDPAEVDKIMHTSQFITPLLNGDQVYYTTHVINTQERTDDWYLGCFDLSTRDECTGFSTVLVSKVDRHSDGGQMHQARLFFYRDSSGRPTSICSSDNRDNGTPGYNQGSYAGGLWCFLLNGNPDHSAQSAMRAAGWIDQQPSTPYMYRGSGVPYYHPGSNRIYSAFLSTGNTTLCYDFNTRSSCTKYVGSHSGPRHAAPNPTPTPVIGATPVPMPSLSYASGTPTAPPVYTLGIRPETYHKAHDSRCVYSAGNVGVVWSMEPNGLYGCPYVGGLIRIDPDGTKWPESYFDFHIGPGTAYKRIRWRLERPNGTLVATSHPDMATSPNTDPTADLQDWNASTPDLGWVAPASKLDLRDVRIGYPTGTAASGEFLVLRVDLELRRKSNGRLPTELWDTGNGPLLTAGQSGLSIVD